MSSKKFLDSKGFTMMELVVASAIGIVVVLGAFQAYNYFNKQTIGAAKKMDDISEFNLLTKDLLSFTEGAGISTFYLNLPIKAKACVADKPCVRELNEQTFVNPTGTLPKGLNDNECVQFYKDSKGTMDWKLADPGSVHPDRIWESKEIEVTGQKELYATWPIKDESSPPFMMIKSRDASIFLTMLSGSDLTIDIINISKLGGLEHAFFESNSPKDVITNLIGYPFLIYNARFTNQYTIQYMSEVVSCETDKPQCLTLLRKIPYMPRLDSLIAQSTQSTFPRNVFAIKFEKINFEGDFFKKIIDRQQVNNCLTSWGEGKQAASGSFFPSSTISVHDPLATSNIGISPLNLLFLNKYFYASQGERPKGAYAAMPIDIVTFKAEPGTAAGTFQLVSELWHHTEIKKKIKIHNLKGSFTITRKLGSPEMGIWYNPIKKIQ